MPPSRKPLTAKDAKDAKENQGETNLDGRVPRLPVRAHGNRPLYPASPLTFLLVLGVLCGECLLILSANGLHFRWRLIRWNADLIRPEPRPPSSVTGLTARFQTFKLNRSLCTNGINAMDAVETYKTFSTLFVKQRALLW